MVGELGLMSNRSTVPGGDRSMDCFGLRFTHTTISFIDFVAVKINVSLSLYHGVSFSQHVLCQSKTPGPGLTASDVLSEPLHATLFQFHRLSGDHRELKIVLYAMPVTDSVLAVLQQLALEFTSYK